MTKDSLPFISGMGYRKLCDYIYDEFEKFNIDNIKQFNGMKIFVKTDLLAEFIRNILFKIKTNFILYSHNSDLGIDEKYVDLLDNKYLKMWYAQNVLIRHNKLKSIPIGIANKRWKHGNVEILSDTINKNNTKDNLIYCNFDINTNIVERKKCIDNIFPITLSPKVDFEQYLEQLSKSYFVISPNGNGIDCHKHWESLYLKTIPIVTDSINIQNFRNEYPFIVIKDWSDFKKLELNEELYFNMIQKLDKNKLYMK